MKIPPECLIERELEVNKCLACKKKCTYGKAIIHAFAKNKINNEYEKKRQEIIDSLNSR